MLQFAYSPESPNPGPKIGFKVEKYNDVAVFALDCCGRA